MKRAGLFALVGFGFFAHWIVANPGFEVSATQRDWPYVLAFSAIILALAFAVPLFAQLVGGRVAFRASLVVAAGSVLSSTANVLEDGLKMEWAFLAFVLGTAIMHIGLLVLTIAIVARGRQRQFALVPAGTMAAVLFYVPVGGPVMFATWLVAAWLALAPTRTQAEAAPTTSYRCGPGCAQAEAARSDQRVSRSPPPAPGGRSASPGTAESLRPSPAHGPRCWHRPSARSRGSIPRVRGPAPARCE
jgi:hypothetical protein